MQSKSVKAVAASATQVWSVKDFCMRNEITEAEQTKLLRLFGEYATECELRYNAKRRPRFH